jgi:putative tricarboxylic transport membrane protein
MALLGVYVLVMDWIGFDAATFLFIAAMMFLQGERRIGWLAGFSLCFAFLVSLFFEYMIPYPMPMLVGKEMIERLL